MKYYHGYREQVTLKNGTAVLLRTLEPKDKKSLSDGLQLLSFSSRYERFLTPKHELTPRELEFLTEFDEQSHYAIGAGILESDGSEGLGIGVARFVAFTDDPTSAEPAVTVIDAWQGQGLGTLLLSRIGEAASERGIKRFKSYFLAENSRIRTLIKRVFPGTQFFPDGSLVTSVSEI